MWNEKYFDLSNYTVGVSIRASILTCIVYLIYAVIAKYDLSFYFFGLGIFMVAILEIFDKHIVPSILLRHSILLCFISGILLFISCILHSNLLVSCLMLLFLLWLTGLSATSGVFNSITTLLTSYMFIVGTGFDINIGTSFWYSVSYILGGSILAIITNLYLKFAKPDVQYHPLIKHKLLKFKKLEINFSIRISIAVIGCYIVSRLWDLQPVYWLPTVALFIQKVDHNLSFQRIKHRLLGTLIGYAISVVIILLVHNKFILSLVVLPIMFFMIICFAKHYGAYIVFLTALTVVS
ncbi:MAG: FUSC family protein [Burkholderiales bacterium]|nr:FUSC family protein [Burkholderiales bacterium]